MANSLPYILLLSAVGLGFAIYLISILDPVVAEMAATDAWASGNEHTMAGRQRLRLIWDNMIPISVVAICMTLLWASRRGAGR